MNFELFDRAKLAHRSCTAAGGAAVNRVITVEDFDRAFHEITQWERYKPTPLCALPALARELALGGILYKDEGQRFGLGSFKALGGAYAALLVLQKQISAKLGRVVDLEDIRSGRMRQHAASITLVSATDGNHGRSLAWGCARFGAACRIYIHVGVSESRADAMRAFGADIIRIKGDYDASVALARDEAAQNNWFVVSDTSWPGYAETPRDVMAGYGVMVRETISALKEPPSHVFLQGGVGGMAAAVAAALRQHWSGKIPRIIIVEPELAACLFVSAGTGKATTIVIKAETIMAGLSCGEPSALAWEILAEEARDFLTIPESVIGFSMRLLARPQNGDPVIEAGESGVAGLAAAIAAARQPALRAALGLDGQSRILVFGSEGITDPDIYARILEGENNA